jgi:hypothetical protein
MPLKIVLDGTFRKAKASPGAWRSVSRFVEGERSFIKKTENNITEGVTGTVYLCTLTSQSGGIDGMVR